MDVRRDIQPAFVNTILIEHRRCILEEFLALSSDIGYRRGRMGDMLSGLRALGHL